MPAAKETVVCEKCGQQLAAGSRFCNLCGAPTAAGSPFAVEEATKKPIRSGDVLEGKWRIDGKIGQGGMGSVFVATDLALERKVAIKALASELCGDEEFVARFEQEAKSTANLEHPNVILVYGVGRHQGRPFIIMKWLQGESLARRLSQAKIAGKPMGVGETLGIVRQICAGLEYIHSAGLVHRDIKAGNIFIGPDGRATILDFGILRNLKSNEALTRVGVVMGTPFYVSPEQATNKGLDHRSDLYALGVMLYEMLTGAPPFQGETEFDVVSQHVHAPPPDPRQKNPALPKEAALVMQKAIAKDPAKRFQSATELADALELAFAVDPSLAQEPGAPTPRSLTQSTTGSLASAQARGSKMLWAGIGLGAAAAIVLGVGVVTMMDAPPPPTPTPQPVKQPKPPVNPLAQARPQSPSTPAVQAPEPGSEDEEGVDEEGEPDAEPGKPALATDRSQAADASLSDDLLKHAVRRDPSRVESLLKRRDKKAPRTP